MTDSFDVAIAGSGIIGLGAAYAAVRRGLRAVVIERSGEPVGASIRNFGHLCIGAQSGTARRYADAARPIWLELARDAGFWLRESGTLVVARHVDELDVLRAAAASGELTVLERAEIDERLTLAPGVALGGAWIAPDLQTDPRAALPAIRAFLAARGVRFLSRTAVTGVRSGAVTTTRGEVFAGQVVVAVNHDIDQLLPGLAEQAGIVRCGLDMLRVRLSSPVALPAPVLTGWSMLRYGRFAGLPGIAAVRERLHAERPDLAALDLNQMYTQLPDGTLLVGDTHERGVTVTPFQSERGAEALLAESSAFWGSPARVIERWQGVYASAPDDFLVASVDDGVLALAATTGIGMTTGLGLAEIELGARWGAAPANGPVEGAS